MNTRVDVSIIVVNYNGANLVVECLNSLEGLNYPRGRYEIIMVDNASWDGSADNVEKNFPGVKIVRNKENYGFAKGNNIGIKNSNPSSKYIALVNNDSRVNKDWLKELTGSMEAEQGAACCGAREETCNPDISINRTGFEGNWMGGGSVIYRRQALEESGLFDERYFAYCEDIDLSWRMKIRGWKIICNNNAVWYHHGAGRKIETNHKVLYLSMRNRLFLLIKFASLKQLLSSLNRYAVNFIFGRKLCPASAQPAAASKISPKQRSLLFSQVFFSLMINLPGLIRERIALFSSAGNVASPDEIDKWIIDNDHYTTYNY